VQRVADTPIMADHPSRLLHFYSSRRWQPFASHQR